MKVAVSAYDTGIDSEINPRFGRCEYILIVDTENKHVEAVPNSNMNLGGGAGIQTAGLAISKGAQAVITGSCGPNAMDVFTASGVDVYTGQTGTVSQAIERLSQNSLAPSTGAAVPEKSGMANQQTGSRGFGAGSEQGCRARGGNGMGMGRGGGRGRGMGMGMCRKG